MHIIVSENPKKLGEVAADRIIMLLNKSIEERGEANYLVSTGASQFTTFDALLRRKGDVEWSKVTMFHLDEYVGLPVTHIASFQKYLRERFTDHVNLKRAVFVNGIGNLERNLSDLSADITAHPIDVGVIGIGENAHIAFNDPPANFDTNCAYRIVTLNDTCKMQQVGEGWFKNIEEVPKQAVSMTPRQIMKCRSIVAPVPDKRKAEAIFATLSCKGINPMVPSSLMSTHSDAWLFLDNDSSSLCTEKMLRNI